MIDSRWEPATHLESLVGLVFIQMVLDMSQVFSGVAKDHTIQCYFIRPRHHPILEESRVIIGVDGLTSVLLWLHVNDPLFHGLSKSKLVTALEFILDTALTLGIIYHSSKTVLPTQQIKFYGFVYNT